MRKAKRLLNPSRVALIAGGLLGFGWIGGLGSSTARAADSVNFRLQLKAIGGTGIDMLDPGTAYTDAIAVSGAAPYTFELKSTVHSDANTGNGIQETQGSFTRTGSLTGEIQAAGSLDNFHDWTYDSVTHTWSPAPVGTHKTAVGVDPFIVNGSSVYSTPLTDIAGTNVAMRGDPSLIDTGTVTGDANNTIGRINVLPGTLTTGSSATISYVPRADKYSFWGIQSGLYRDGTQANVVAGAAGHVLVPDTSAAVSLADNTAVKGNISFNGLGIAAGKSLAVLDGTVEIAGTQSHGPDSSLKVFGGTTNVRTDPGAGLNVIANGGTVNIGQAAVGAGGAYNTKTISALGASVINVPDNVTNAGRKLVITNDLTIGAAAKLNLDGNSMIINYPTGQGIAGPAGDFMTEGAMYAKIKSYLMTGSGGGSTTNAWNRPGGITSAAAADDWANLGAIQAIGMLDNQDIYLGAKSTFMGHTLNPTGEQILLRYTYTGDANLDGKVDSADLDAFSNGYYYQQEYPGATLGKGWSAGDFNYDGVINSADLDMFSLAYYYIGEGYYPPEMDSLYHQLRAAMAIGPAASVPEPGVLVLAGAAMCALSMRRRRR